MQDWQIFAVWFAALMGAIAGGFLGFRQRLKQDPTIKWCWLDLVETAITGTVGGGLWVLLTFLGNMEFGAAAIIAGFLHGAGVDYTAKKTVLNR